MKCPRCGHGLEAAELDHVKVHDCAQCGGTWFEHDELQRAKANADKWVRWINFDVFSAAESTPEKSQMQCPECGKAMVLLVYPHSKVKIDVCGPDHGVWLDKGEFDKLVKALDDLTNELSTRDFEHALVHELKEVVSGGHESRLAEIRDFMAVFRLLEMRIGIEHPKTAQAIDVLAKAGI